MSSRGKGCRITDRLSYCESCCEGKCEKLPSRVENLWTSHRFSDCTFSVGLDATNQKVIYGHKVILAAASPMFARMFYGDFTNEMPISVSNFEADTFCFMLDYIYTDKTPEFKSMKDACDLYSAADYFLIPHLSTWCKGYIRYGITAENACEILEFAELHRISSLAKECEQIMCSETEAVLKAPSFVDASSKTLLTIFGLQRMNPRSESYLIEAFQNYVDRHGFDILKIKENIAKTSTTKDEKPSSEEKDIIAVFCKIRFLTLSAREFCRLMSSCKLFSNEDALAILTNIIKPGLIPMPEGYSTEGDAFIRGNYH